MIKKKKSTAKIYLVIFFLLIIAFTIYGILEREPDKNKSAIQMPGSDIPIKTEKTGRMNEILAKSFSNWDIIFDIFSLNLKKYNDLSYEILENPDSVKKIRRFRPVFKSGNVNAIISDYGDFIKERCNYYNIDWRLILAIIHQESFFDSMAVSRAGAFGLMQIMPRTGMGLQSQLNLEDTRSAKNNLTAGIHYYANLVATFEAFGEDKYKFALASYNAGLSRMVDVMTIAAYHEKDYKIWDEVKEYFPMLSASYDSVHKQVWPRSGRPSGGVLNNWKEPYYYVEYVSYFFEEYKKLLEPNLQEKVKKKTKRRR